jgi:hypothetical protein
MPKQPEWMVRGKESEAVRLLSAEGHETRHDRGEQRAANRQREHRRENTERQKAAAARKREEKEIRYISWVWDWRTKRGNRGEAAAARWFSKLESLRAGAEWMTTDRPLPAVLRAAVLVPHCPPQNPKLGPPSNVSPASRGVVNARRVNAVASEHTRGLQKHMSY